MKRSGLRRVFNSNTFFFLFILGIILARIFIFVPITVVGESMSPTLADGERGIAIKVGPVERFDIITFPAPDAADKNYIKRVIGLPGDTIEYQNDVLYINGQAYEEPYLDEYKNRYSNIGPFTENFATGEVPPGEYFVLGDNRQNSKDSRYFDTINGHTIQGDLKFAYWPPEKIGGVE